MVSYSCYVFLALFVIFIIGSIISILKGRNDDVFCDYDDEDVDVDEVIPTEDEIKQIPPFGRKGLIDGEVRLKDNVEWYWSSKYQKWFLHKKWFMYKK